MRGLKLLATAASLGVLGVGVIASLGLRHAPAVQIIDFGARTPDPAVPYAARVAPPSDAPIKEFIIPIEDETITVANGVTYRGWTFGGSVPGPVIRVRQGDQVRIRVINRTSMPHSIDFHAARIPPNVAYRMIAPGQSISFEFTARDPGAFLVHCGTAPVTLHLMQGMYLPMIVDPRDGWGSKADDEFVIVQSEFYTKSDSAGVAQPDFTAAMDRRASYVVFNGRAFQYKTAPLQVNVGDRVRFFVVNAGPTFESAFHVVGAIFDRVYPDGDPAHVLTGVQTEIVPPGGGAVFETRFAPDESGEGVYPFVTHSFVDAERGAIGLIRVGHPVMVAGAGH